LQLGDADAVVNVQAVRDRLKNFNFFGPLTAKSGLDEFFVSSEEWESLEDNVKDLFVHHSASLPTKEQMVAEKVRQKHLNAPQGGSMMNNQRQQRERKAWLNQHLQYDRIKAAQIQQQEQEYQIQQEMQRRQRQQQWQQMQQQQPQQPQWSPGNWEQQQLQQEMQRRAEMQQNKPQAQPQYPPPESEQQMQKWQMQQQMQQRMQQEQLQWQQQQQQLRMMRDRQQQQIQQQQRMQNINS